METKDKDSFYYYEKEKIFLKQLRDKIFLKFKSETDKEKIQTIINCSDLLQLIDGAYCDEGSWRFAALETKDGKHIPMEIMKYFNESKDVVSVIYLFLEKNSGFSLGLMDELVVKFNATTSYEQLKGLAEKYNCIIGNEDVFVRNQFMLYVTKTSELDAMQTANLFYETGLFEFAEPNMAVLNSASTNDTFWGEQWGLRNIGQSGGKANIDIKAESAWSITTGSPNINIAVIDNGVNLTHEDLQLRLLPGFDATGGGSNGGPAAGINHGTVCAGVAGAIQNNSLGISGVAPNCRMIPIRAEVGNTGNWAFTAAAINWAVANRADVISHSWNGPFNTQVSNAIINATSNGRNGNGCVFVNSAGNDPYNVGVAVTFPGTMNEVIAVGAINRNGIRASSSNFGTNLNVVAPGVDIRTTNFPGNAAYIITSGTSLAAPHVAGIAALILSVRPDLRQDQVRDAIELNCNKNLPNWSVSQTRPNGTWNTHLGFGLVNADAAVRSVARYISGPNAIYFSGTEYTLNNPPAGTITWGITGPFSLTAVANNSAKIKVVRFSSSSSSSGVLTAYVNNLPIASMSISGVSTYISGPNYLNWGNSYYFSLPYEAGAYYDWSLSSGPLYLSHNGQNGATFTVDNGGGWDSGRIFCKVTLNGVSSDDFGLHWVDIS